MFIYTIKGQNLKLYISLFLSALAIVLVTTLVPAKSNQIQDSSNALEVGKTISQSDFKNIKTNKDRVSFLKLFGWEVETEARDVTQVTIPVKFDTTYEKYNTLQMQEGLDLEKYKGKTVKKYTYLVNNYEYEGTVFANLLIYKNRVIGGDICSANVDGFLHGFSKDSNFMT